MSIHESANVHPSAVIDEGAKIGPEVTIEPYVVIGPHVVLDEGVEVGPHAVIQGRTRIGARSRISSFAAIGLEPQDMGYKGEETLVEIGADCSVREFVTIHRGTEKGGGLTYVGNACMIMAYCHVAHDCRVSDHVTMANGATLAGHVEIQERAVIGGLTAIHQFARIGRNAFVGGASAVSMDVVPYMSAAGNRSRVTGVNVVGLRRQGFSEEDIKVIRRAHRIVFRSNLRLEQALEQVERELPPIKAIQCLLEFIHTSQRGICR